MATLEKIRKRSVLLLVIIGAALVAFIIGDFLNSGRNIFGDGTTVAKVDGEKIDYLAFQQRYSEFTEQNKNASQQDAATVQNQVLGTMIQETLFNEEYDALGIDVTDAELSNYMYKQMAMRDQDFAQTLGQLVQSLAGNEKANALLGNATSQEMMVQSIRKIIFNPNQFGLTSEQVKAAQDWWLTKENDATEQLKQAKFGMLFQGAVQANALEIEAMKAQRMNSYDVQMVAIPYASLKDDDYKVSDEEIKAVYNAEKNRFATSSSQASTLRSTLLRVLRACASSTSCQSTSAKRVKASSQASVWTQSSLPTLLPLVKSLKSTLAATTAPSTVFSLRTRKSTL